MGWYEQQMRKYKLQKEIDRAMASNVYKEMHKKERADDVMRAFGTFCRFGCEFLELKHRYGHDGLTNFLEWMQKRATDLIEDETYFRDVDAYYLEKYNLDLPNLTQTTHRGREE